MANGRSFGFVAVNGGSISRMGFIGALTTSSNWLWMMSMISLLSILSVMVVTVMKRGAGNGARRGNRASRGGRGNGGSRGNRDEGCRGNSSGEDADSIQLGPFFERADRSVSTGHHPNVPLDGQPKKGIVSFTGKYINENIHKKTLKAISRDLWPKGAVDSVDKPRTQFFDDGYYKDVLDEFEKYYDYDNGVPVAVARAKVKAHLKTNLKNTISWELTKANIRVQNSEPGTTQHDVKPVHIKLDVWDALCDWWDSPKFKRMSKKNKENKKRKMLLHTTSAKPYVIFRLELEKKEWRMLTFVEFFDATHEKKKPKRNFLDTRVSKSYEGFTGEGVG